eukprot:361217-Chlamydomonas_euryale.AAC.11
MTVATHQLGVRQLACCKRRTASRINSYLRHEGHRGSAGVAQGKKRAGACQLTAPGTPKPRSTHRWVDPKAHTRQLQPQEACTVRSHLQSIVAAGGAAALHEADVSSAREQLAQCVCDARCADAVLVAIAGHRFDTRQEQHHCMSVCARRRGRHGHMRVWQDF